MLNAFLEYIEALVNPGKLRSLRRIFCSGEALLPHHVKKFNQWLAGNQTRLINLYGPTEAAIDVSYFNCSPGKNIDEIPIGKPIENIKLYIVDPFWHLHIKPI